MSEKPLNVRIAEAIGAKPVDAIWGYPGPPAEGGWSHERARLFQTPEEAHAACVARDLATDYEPTLCYWKDGWGPLMIEAYDQEWSATGPLIEKYRLHVEPDACHEPDWVAFGMFADDDAIYEGTGSTALIAVCNLILVLGKAGKL